MPAAMTTMGELTASLAHEVNQPITAAVNGASTCVRWLTRDEPDLAEAREAAAGAIRNAKTCRGTLSNRIRSILEEGRIEAAMLAECQLNSFREMPRASAKRNESVFRFGPHRT